MGLLQAGQAAGSGRVAAQSGQSRDPRSHDFKSPGRRLRQDGQVHPCRGAMAEIRRGMAPRSARRYGTGKASRSGTKNSRSEAPPGAAENPGRRKAVVAYLPMKSVRVPAHAKVNLRLEILGRRPDGYHELRTIFQSITLHDTLTLETIRKPGIDLRIAGNSQLAGEPGPDNLVYRAIRDLSRAIGFRQGVRAVLTKRIPVGRGLGGGSSDAAAALIGMLRLTGKRIEGARLSEIASGLGADVPFFLHGGRALGIGRGDETYPLPDVPRRTLLVVSPRDIAVPTRDAYQWLARRLTNDLDTPKLSRFCVLCWSPQGGALSHDFEAAGFPRCS